MSKKTRFCWTMIPLSVGVVSVAGQTPANGDSSSMRSVVAVRADKAPELDGTLKGDAGWQDASLISDFRQREPFERQPPTEKTEVRVLNASRYLSFSIHSFH